VSGRKGLTLVTGASGFVGCHVVLKLLSRGEPVRVLKRAASPMKNLEGLEVETLTGDLTDPASLREAVSGCRWLYHVAADYRLWSPDPASLYKSNVEGTRNLLEAARAAGVERTVYTSSVGALGIPKTGSGIGEENTPVRINAEISGVKPDLLAASGIRWKKAPPKKPPTEKLTR